ncbi:MAG TPA: hypothetical protein VFF49_11295 [Thermodesulfobacteriota bacterium]|nr:hypothetical protein [Thermodesulfobacteriota bacterium]
MKETGEKSIIAEDNKGNRYFIPSDGLRVEKKDYVARALAVGAFIAGSAGLVYTAVSNVAEGKRDHENLVGDCLNENILRQAMGAPGVTLDECREERGLWANPAPVATPTGGG